MSLQNRYIKEEGSYTVKHENKLQTLAGRLFCLFKGHKEVIIKTNEENLKYCMCCWKELD